MVNTIKKLGCCRLCRSTFYHVLFIKEGYNVAKCDTCGMVFLDFDPDGKFFTEYYSKEFFNDTGTKHAYSDYEKEAESLKKSFIKRCNIIKKYKDNGALLDLGCATGAFLETATRYWKVFGVDISEYATSQAKLKNLDVFCGNLNDSPYIKYKFDVITLWDTIEHISNPKLTIRQSSKILNQGGILTLTTGDVGSVFSKLCGRFWHLYNIPQHLSFFDKFTVSKMLEDEGFIVREILYLPINLTLDYLLFRLITFYNLGFLRPLYKYLKQLNILDKNININLYDIMFVVAQKKDI